MKQARSATEQAEIAVFGPQAPWMFAVLRAMVRDLEHTPVRYQYLSEEDFLELFRSDVVGGVRVQVSELLYQAHFASVATLVRAYRWAEGCLAAYSQNLYLPFCASARGLLEAVGDSHTGLARIPLSLAEASSDVRAGLAKTSPPALHNYEEIENILLHFSHARRLSKEEKAALPEYARAQDPKDYTLPIEAQCPGGFYAWYQELCELTHPASDSVCYTLNQEDDGQVSFNPSIDHERIAAHVGRHQERLTELLRLAQVPAITTLRVLVHFPMPELHVKSVAGLDMSRMPLWRKCAAKLGVVP